MSLFSQLCEAIGAKRPGSTGKKEAEQGASEDRKLVRKRQHLIEGFIVSDKMLTPRPCTVRDLTHFGSQVDLWDDIRPALLDPGLTLYLAADRKEVACNVAWVRGRSIGLRFTSSMRPATRRYGKA